MQGARNFAAGMPQPPSLQKEGRKEGKLLPPGGAEVPVEDESEEDGRVDAPDKEHGEDAALHAKGVLGEAARGLRVAWWKDLIGGKVAKQLVLAHPALIEPV